ncbi:hypothetical protein SAMN05216559_1537 [Halomicrobium zhouii]|uniref:Uncharacterized protein n=1 Tax=Halomicrobium zhouii TaxID=767519 RepID=A0A1I6KTY6_9EURY|nr:hypothetical protein [Halomicrobium zhouii]SFR94488.1 hypothetical protein SAMN05216559_1537 [Halomicrobium zhouii]
MTDRAASEVLSFALVFGLVVASVAIVSVSGLGSLESARDAEQMNNAERAFDVLGDNMADIYERGAPSRATEVSLGESQLYTDENVSINVTVKDSAGNPTTVTRDIRPIVYDGDRERELVYEAGAVFRVERQGALVLQEPPFVVENDRVMIPVVAAQSSSVESTGGSTVLLRANNRGTDVVVSDSRGSVDSLYFNISSPRNELWRDYFVDDPDFDCGATPIETINGEEYLECEHSNPRVVHVVVYDIGVTIDR